MEDAFQYGTDTPHCNVNLSRKRDIQYEVTNMGQCNFYQLYVLLVVKFIVGTNVHGASCYL